MAHTVMATFQVRTGEEEQLSSLLDRHHAAILAGGYGLPVAPVRVVRQTPAGAVLHDIFDWQDGGVSKAAADPAITAIWRDIDACCERRGDVPACDFPAVRRLR